MENNLNIIYDQYLKEYLKESSTSLELPNKKEDGKKSPNGFTIELLMGLSNKLIIKKPPSIGSQSSSSIVYYTPSERVVGVERISGQMNVPFGIGDELEDVKDWAEKNQYETDTFIKRRKTLRENENDEVEVKELTLYEVCFNILTNKWTDDMESQYSEEYLTNIAVIGRRGVLTFEFESESEWLEFFAEQSENYSLYDIGSHGADYEYYTDSAYQDVQDECYHLIQIGADHALELHEFFTKLGFTFKHEASSADRSSNHNFINDGFAFELKSLLQSHFPKWEEKISEEYQETYVESHAQGFKDALNKSYDEWLDAGERLVGLEEVEYQKEYTFQVDKLIRYLIQIRNKELTVLDLIQDKKLNSQVGSGADLWSYDEARYDYSDDTRWGELKPWIIAWKDEMMEDIEMNYLDEIKEFNNDKKHILSLGLEITNDSSTKSDRYGRQWDRANDGNVFHRYSFKYGENNGYTDKNVKKTSDGRYLYYYGYIIQHEGHVVWLETEKGSEKFEKRLFSIGEIVNLLKQLSLDLNEGRLLEQKEENIVSYYGIMGGLVRHYGEDNVSLNGDPAKITIYSKSIVTWDGKDLLMTIDGKVNRVKVTEYSNTNINGEDVSYPSIKYITNRIPKVVSTKIETPNKLNKDNRTLLDGTKLRASKTFWTDLKSLEGAIGTNGSPVLNAYRLGDGRTTIGWGHTGAMSGKTPKMGDVITKEQAQELLNVDATEAANCVRRFLMGWKKQGLNSYMITQNMFDVLVSLSFNSGCPNLRSSEFIKLVKKGKHTEAAKLLPTDSTMIHGGFTKGLTARRKKESKQFLK